MKRIMIFGRPGNGKSTFANRLSKTLSLPVYHLDKYFFESSWRERDTKEFIDIQKNLVSREAWIIDGNSTKTLEIRWSKADVVIYLDLPKWICIYRIIKRIFTKDRTIDDRAPNCPEVLRWPFLVYAWRFENRVKNIIPQLTKTYEKTPFYVISSQKDFEEITTMLCKAQK